MVWNPAMLKILGIWFIQDLKCAAINNNKKNHEFKKTVQNLVT